jgi:hypothetical protein
MATKTARRLKNLKITRVDLVGKGANQHSHVTLLKNEAGAIEKGQALACPSCKGRLETRYGDSGYEMPKFCGECGAAITISASGGTEETSMAKMTDEQAAEMVAKLEKAEADLKAEQAKVADLEKAAAAPVAKADAPVDIFKGLTPEGKAALAASIEKADASEKRIAKMEEDAAVARFEKRAETVGKGVPGWNAEKGGKILKALDGLADKSLLADLETVLKSAAEVIKTGKVFEESGVPGTAPETGGATALAQIRAKAAEITKADPKVQGRDAILKAMDEDPELAARYSREMSQSAPRESSEGDE